MADKRVTDPHLILYYIGICIIFASHLFMLIQNPILFGHALLNIVAAMFIAYYFLHREGYIKF